METTNEILYKTCKTCKESKELSRYRPSARHCKRCANAKDADKRILSKREFYKRHQEQLQEENRLNYYKKIYNNNNLSMHEVNLFRIAL